jgi:hypothetical protein
LRHVVGDDVGRSEAATGRQVARVGVEGDEPAVGRDRRPALSPPNACSSVEVIEAIRVVPAMGSRGKTSKSLKSSPATRSCAFELNAT